MWHVPVGICREVARVLGPVARSHWDDWCSQFCAIKDGVGSCLAKAWIFMLFHHSTTFLGSSLTVRLAQVSERPNPFRWRKHRQGVSASLDKASGALVISTEYPHALVRLWSRPPWTGNPQLLFQALPHLMDLPCFASRSGSPGPICGIRHSITIGQCDLRRLLNSMSSGWSFSLPGTRMYVHGRLPEQTLGMTLSKRWLVSLESGLHKQCPVPFQLGEAVY